MDALTIAQGIIEKIIDRTLAFLNTIFSKTDTVVTTVVTDPVVPSYHFKSILEVSPLKIIIMAVIILMGIGIVYAYIRLHELEKKDAERMSKYFIRPVPQKRTNDRWDKVSALFQSANEADWRLGIMEADVMLDEMTLALGYKGETLGERLKQIEQSDFPMLQPAWQAHLLRNKIAHEGMGYNLSHQEAWRGYKLFEAVFRSAGFIE